MEIAQPDPSNPASMTVTAERVDALGSMGCSRKPPEIARLASVIENRLPIQLLQLVVFGYRGHANTWRAFSSATIS